MTLIRSLLALAAISATVPVWASEAHVTLSSPDSGLVVEGDLIEQRGEFFRVLTEYGAVTLDAGGLVCEGSGCPPAENRVVRSGIAGPSDLLTELLAPLLEGFAKSRDLAFSETFLSDTDLIWTLADLETEEVLAEFTVGPDIRSPDLLVSRIATEPKFFADVIALDAVVAIVSPENPVATMSTPTLRLLLEGRLDIWPGALTGLTGNDALDVSIHLPTSLASLGRIWPYSPINPALSAKQYRNPDALADAVASEPGALGIVPLSRIGNATPLVLAGPCGRVLPATPALVKAEDYPLAEPVYVERVTALQPKLVRDFIEFAQSPEAQPIIRRTGLVDHAIGRIPFSDQGDRLGTAILAAEEDAEAEGEVRRLIRALAGGERLTLTFRFEDGAAILDAPSRSNVRQLGEAILSGVFADHDLLFAGFTDSQGPAEANLRLSLRRAESVAGAVKKVIGDVEQGISVDGFGESLPMACDDTHWGREINRRVEVWTTRKRVAEN